MRRIKRIIDADALKDFIKDVCFGESWVRYRIDNGFRGQIRCILKYIDNAPLAFDECADTQGEWLWIGFDGDKLKWSCSLCGRGVEEQENYCPKCGAKMSLDKEVNSHEQN